MENGYHSLTLESENSEKQYKGKGENFKGYSMITFRVAGDDYFEFVKEFDSLIVSLEIIKK